MLFALTRRVLTETNPKVVAKFVYNFGLKGVRSVELHKRRRRRLVTQPCVGGRQEAMLMVVSAAGDPSNIDNYTAADAISSGAISRPDGA